jgi:hypothetical protein
MNYKVKTRGYLVLEFRYDKFKGYRPSWCGWEETFRTRRDGQIAMANHVNELNGARKGHDRYVRKADSRGMHDVTTYIVCSPDEAQEMIDSHFLRSGCHVPFWVEVVEGE